MSKHVRLLDKYDCEVVREYYNPLIKRREIELNLFHGKDGTPSRGVLKRAIASLYNVDINLVFIRFIKTEYGMSVSRVKVHIYENPDRARAFEPEYIIKRDEESLSKLTQTTQPTQ
ncbi:MAG: 30S ribosomal protein S24e [Desulfurococcaceae archaeon]|nr:30S ribosomal protein S24e [Desulfurococcaceae archaeon]